jgi:cyclomaltodextrinase
MDGIDVDDRVLAARGERVTVRCRLPIAQLELRGELPCWEQAVPMRLDGGWAEARLRLGAGVYEYKLAAPGGRWWLDPDNPRTRGAGGVVNSALVVGGSDEPVLHAPAAPWIERRRDGALVVRAALRRGHGESLQLRSDDGAGLRAIAMRAVGGEDQHVLFEAVVAGAGRRLDYGFGLADGRVIGAAGRLLAAEVAAPDVPAWWREAIVYTVLVDRFRRAGGWQGTPWARDARAGGDLDGVIEALPYLADLGVTALHLTPVCVAPSPHRYDVVDPFTVDPALGGEAAFARLIAAADDRGLRILVDVTTTHLHRDAAPFRDVAARGPASPYWRWFRTSRWPFHDGPDPGYEHYQKGQWQEPLLATDDPGVGEHLVAVVEGWLGRGVDGVRLDAAADLPVPLVARLRVAARAIRPDAVVFGEVVPASVERWTLAGHLDAATDFAGQRALAGWLGGDSAASMAAEATGLRFRRGGDGARLLGFTGTHDQPRLGSRLGADAARLGLFAVLVRAPVPLLYYGDEVGLAAGDAARDFEDSWPDRQCMPWQPAAWDAATHGLVTAAAALRRQLPVLAGGDEELLAVGDDVLVVRRRLGRDLVDAVLHRGAAATRVTLPDAGAAAGARVLFTLGAAALVGDALELGPWSACVVDRSPVAVDAELADANPALAIAAFAAAQVVTPAYPVRLALTVTEACNLRCAHCITDAPGLTREGRARTLRPWLLDALDDSFAHADHVSFVHGGEALTAAIFPDVLARIQRARARRSGRADVHLVTNGMLLDGERVRRLADLGVTSVMVSLDGATAAINDRIRLGGSFDRVVANLRAAAALRTRAGLDLRLGISSVLGRGNRHQVAALAALAIELGADWLKLEETWPATPFARLDAFAADDELRAAIAAAGHALDAAGVVLVDHVDPPAGCPCSTDDPRVHGFRRADDFANRFRLRPCCLAWQQAAIDPDGTLHLGDYGGPVLGSLQGADALALWNGPVARAARTAALAATTPEARARCAALSRP